MDGRVRAAVDDTVSAYSGRSAVVLNLGARSKRSAKSRLADPWMTSGGTGRPWESLGELERRSRLENGVIRLQIWAEIGAVIAGIEIQQNETADYHYFVFPL